MEIFKGFFAILITLLIMSLYILPAYMLALYSSPGHTWGLFYLPVVVFTFLWGYIIKEYYFKK